jgi:hypothetical protein
MAQPTLYKLSLDKTGVNPDNRLVDEPHDLPNGRFRAVAPMYGAFFIKGFIVKDALNDRVLTLGQDYRFIELYATLTQLFDQEVAGVVVITNSTVSARVLVTYQAVGDHYAHNNEALVNLLGSDVGQQVSESYLDVVNKQTTFVPVPHVHDIGNGMGFEFLVYALERLRAAIVWADVNVIQALIDKIERALSDLANVARYRQDTELAQYLIDYREKFTKETFGLGKVMNLPPASVDEGRFAARDEFSIGGPDKERYVTLSSLIAFKQELLTRVVSADDTFLGRQYGVLVQPRLDAYASLSNGAKVIIDSFESVSLSLAPFDRSAYPDLDATKALHRFAITKVTNNLNNKGGVFQGFNMSTAEQFVGVMTITNGVYALTWQRLMTQVDSAILIESLSKHLTNYNNPHRLNKNHIGLPNLENYPVASDRQILSRVPVNAYITHKQLLLFLSAYLTEKWKLDMDGDTLTEEQKKRNLRAYENLFSTCGSNVENGGGISLNAPPTTPKPTVEPYGTEKGHYCLGTTKVITFADGFGGTFVQTFENNADCGFQMNQARFAIKDLDGTRTIGYGYAAGEAKDPGATIAVTGPTGEVLAYIFPDAAQGRQSQIRNFSGDLIGFAINP